MMPSFKKDLFNNFIITQESKDINKLEDLRYSVIYNLKITFENLKNGSMTPYPPKRFIKSFLSAFNGEPIQFGVQQDSDEFLSILCDNLEKEGKSYNKENFLENSFKTLRV
jgi:ubiquitin C-terminal hydrolase